MIYNVAIERGFVMNQDKVGKFISLSRKNKNLTQQQLAEKLGVSINAVSKWERGLNSPDVSLMEELCKCLDISLNELFEGQKLTDKEIIKTSEKNIMNILMTKKQLETMQIFNEILIFVGIIITITLSTVLTTSNIQKVLVMILGSFVWIFGIFLRVKVMKALNNLKD